MHKIVIANRRYFKSFGPSQYLFNIKKMLEQDGCEVIPFSVKRSMNYPTPYEKYFVSPLYGDDVIFFNDARVSFLSKLKIFARCIYSREAKRNMRRLLDNEQIDLVYLLHIANDISPSIISACKERNIPVVIRLSDFNLMCGNYHFMRDNTLCTLCVDKHPLECIRHKCVKDALMPSIARTVSIMVHNALGIYDYVDAFICPCAFLKDSLIRAGFPAEKIFQVNSFIDASLYNPANGNRGYILYFGRISPEKGIDHLLKAMQEIGEPIPLYLVGSSNNEPYLASLKDFCKEHGLDNVSFPGRKDGDELVSLIKGANFVVMPSICPDNSPMSVLEAMACAKPVIGSDIGGIPEQVMDGTTGYLYPPTDTHALAEKIRSLWHNPKTIETMGEQARIHIEKNFSSQQHFSKLKSIFTDCINKHANPAQKI